MKRINKSSVLSLFCAFVMLLSLCLIPGVKSEAAAKAPAIDKSIVMCRNSYNRTIRIKNMKKGDVITKAVPKGNVLENNIFYDVEHVFERVVNDDHWFNDDMGKDVNFFSSVSGNVITDVLPQYELPHLKYGNLK